jgi:hypothetical protein
MISSISTGAYTLAADVRGANPKRFMVELLNLRVDDPKAVERFARRFREWLPQYRDVYTIEARRRLEGYSPPPDQRQSWEEYKRRMKREAIGDHEVWTVEPTSQERLRDTLATRRLLKEVWGLPTPFLREFGILDLLAVRLDYAGRARLLGIAAAPHPIMAQTPPESTVRLAGSGVVQDISRPVLGRFELALMYCMRSAERLRVCPNTECVAPYFIAQRRTQKYCSEKCAQPSQREFKRRWWDEHGDARRKAQKLAGKKPRRKRGK